MSNSGRFKVGEDALCEANTAVSSSRLVDGRHPPGWFLEWCVTVLPLAHVQARVVRG